MNKRLFAVVLTLCFWLTAVGFAAAETDAMTVWAIESTRISDYQTNGQSLWMQEKTGVDVNWISTPRTGWFQAFQASVMSGEAVDIYLYDFDTSEATMLGTEMGFIIPLEDYINAETTPNIYAILEENPEIRELITAPDGHIYTLFTNNAYDLNAYKQKLWVNRFFLEKYEAETGCGMPQTTAEFEKMLQYFAANDMNGDGKINEIPMIGQNGVDGIYYLSGAFLPVNSGNGFGFTMNEENELTFSFNQEAYKEALAYARNLYAQGLISPDTFTISVEERYALTSGSRKAVRAGVVTGVTAAQVVQLSNEEDAMTYADYLPLPPLQGPEGVRTIVSPGETMLSLRSAITMYCEDPVTAIKWLDAGYSEAARLYAVYGGEENVDWTYAQGETLAGTGKVITALHEIGDNDVWGGQGIVYRITEEDYLMMDASGLAVNDALATYRANLAYRPYAVKNPWKPVVWPGEYADEGAQYSEINSLIGKEVTAYYTDVILGRTNLEEDWDTYNETLKAMGLERYAELTALYIRVGE